MSNQSEIFSDQNGLSGASLVSLTPPHPVKMQLFVIDPRPFSPFLGMIFSQKD